MISGEVGIMAKRVYVLKDDDEVTINGKLLRGFKKLVIAETLNVKPEQVFVGKVVKSGNGAVITFKKRFIGRQVFVVVKGKF